MPLQDRLIREPPLAFVASERAEPEMHDLDVRDEVALARQALSTGFADVDTAVVERGRRVLSDMVGAERSVRGGNVWAE